ncbi:MAG: hypothetical protein LUO88_01395 [Methanoregulaceae archaeon]|nr:hypothetical protein [Methanoregulaceae archaeon]
MLQYCCVSGEYKRIERRIAEYIASRYRSPAEVGIGDNPVTARLLAKSGLDVLATDIRVPTEPPGVRFVPDDLFTPDRSLYRGRDLLYSIRPGEEMMAPLIALARSTGCDLLVYHLGFEGYGDSGELIDCGVVLHLYRHRANQKRVD